MAASRSGAPKSITAGGTENSSAMLTPTTLAKMEDPRAWHARGEAGIRPAKPPARVDDVVAPPMAPPPPRGHTLPAQKTVLEEDEYVERLGDIIEKDYFPHNSRMSRALAGLGGSAADGSSSAHGVGGFAATPTPGGATPGGAESQSGRGGEGGERTGHRGGAGQEGEASGRGGALTKFVATHTSEDNQAFAELQVTPCPNALPHVARHALSFGSRSEA